MLASQLWSAESVLLTPNDGITIKIVADSDCISSHRPPTNVLTDFPPARLASNYTSRHSAEIDDDRG